MNFLSKYLDDKNITRYQISKLSGIPQSTINSATESKTGTDGITGRIIKAIALATNETPGKVLDDLIRQEKYLALPDNNDFVKLDSAFKVVKTLDKNNRIAYKKILDLCKEKNINFDTLGLPEPADFSNIGIDRALYRQLILIFSNLERSINILISKSKNAKSITLHKEFGINLGKEFVEEFNQNWRKISQKLSEIENNN